MRPGRPSGTSSLVTLVRALAHEGLTEVRDFKDPTAFVMLPPAWQLACKVILWRRRNPHFRERTFNARSGGESDLVPLRTRVLDEAWHRAHTDGVGQLVLLGAGLDGRAFRLDDIGDSTVFEVDHPVTQGLKRERSAQLSHRARRHAFVPVDFERDSLAHALEAAGQNRDVPTCWIWEGVTSYLTRQAQRQTLGAIADRSAPGSRLAMTYTEPSGANKSAAGLLRLGLVVRLFGEPFIGLLTRSDVSELLSEVGFRLEEDSGVEDWRRRHTDNPNRAGVMFSQRIALAERAR